MSDVMESPARERSRRGEGEQLRDVLLDAAEEMLGELRDVEKLSVRAVTKRAGVSPSALYLHFADKAELTIAIKDRGFRRLLAALTDAEQAAGDDPSDALVAMAEAYFAFAREEPAIYAVLFGTYLPRNGLPLERDAAGLGPGEQVFAAVQRAVGRCLAAGGHAADDRALFDEATVVWMALHGRASVARAMPSFPFAQERDFARLLTVRFSGGAVA